MIPAYLSIPIFFILILLLNYLYYYLRYGNIDTEQKRTEFMNNVMGTMFITLALLKISDLNKFSDIFQQYDIISKSFPSYSKIFPFIEFLIGFLFLSHSYAPYIYYLALIFVGSNLISIISALMSNSTIPCGCFGGWLNLKLSYISVFENIFMLLMVYLLL